EPTQPQGFRVQVDSPGKISKKIFIHSFNTQESRLKLIKVLECRLTLREENIPADRWTW
ncbi:hypothetical protein AVEN_240019-1, partial [Araneus ventricosus]